MLPFILIAASFQGQLLSLQLEYQEMQGNVSFFLLLYLLYRPNIARAHKQI
ncbi:hypothetical protein F383_06006 [Gossypium arboreum]|uniref:Uncharacterized protein n=1 Tax=Gossypium arboreum TaxID=29729 RepID=A0A0B0NX96_GOSAR|nr:hypothetical protein F383_06006 [Gossypium arboreum]